MLPSTVDDALPLRYGGFPKMPRHMPPGHPWWAVGWSGRFRFAPLFMATELTDAVHHLFGVRPGALDNAIQETYVDDLTEVRG